MVDFLLRSLIVVVICEGWMLSLFVILLIIISCFKILKICVR